MWELSVVLTHNVGTFAGMENIICLFQLSSSDDSGFDIDSEGIGILFPG
jgi:hypothetical protein